MFGKLRLVASVHIMRRLFFILSFSFLTAAFIIIAPVSVLAVTVGPAKMEYRVDPGAVVENTIILINDSGAKQTLWPAFEKFTEVNGEKKFRPAESTELANWIKLPESVTLEPAEQKRIPFTIEIPQKAPPGGHFAVIWWGTAPPQGPGQVSIVTRAGILVYLQVSGQVNESAEVLRFSAEGKRFFWGKMPESFVVSFRNSGNTYQKPQGEILIKNIFKGKIVDFGVNDVNVIFLPDTEANLRIAKKFNKPPFAFGLYKAELVLRWGEKPESIKKSIWFFVFPWKQALGGIIALAILFFGLKKGIRKYNQWIIKKARESVI